MKLAKVNRFFKKCVAFILIVCALSKVQGQSYERGTGTETAAGTGTETAISFKSGKISF